MTVGSKLFEEVEGGIRSHFYLKEGWHYTIAAVWTMQAKVTSVLPAVFYLPVGGSIGTAKTALQSFLAKLTCGLKFENVSIPALARTMHPYQPIFIDEYQVSRGKEYDAIRDALLRTGYKRDAAPYVRWDATRRQAEQISVYSAKCIGYTGALDPAMQNRGYPVPSVQGPPGLEGYDLVRANLWQEVGDLPDRVEAWGKHATEEYPERRLKELAGSKEFTAKLVAATVGLGANRETELATVAMLVAEIVGIDLADELKEANKLREIETFAASDSDLDLFKVAVLKIASTLKVELPYNETRARIKQSDVRATFDSDRGRQGEGRRMSDPQFAQLRELAGIDKTMLGRHGRATYLDVPIRLFQQYYEEVGDQVPGLTLLGLPGGTTRSPGQRALTHPTHLAHPQRDGRPGESGEPRSAPDAGRPPRETPDEEDPQDEWPCSKCGDLTPVSEDPLAGRVLCADCAPPARVSDAGAQEGEGT